MSGADLPRPSWPRIVPADAVRPRPSTPSPQPAEPKRSPAPSVAPAPPTRPIEPAWAGWRCTSSGPCPTDLVAFLGAVRHMGRQIAEIATSKVGAEPAASALTRQMTAEISRLAEFSSGLARKGAAWTPAPEDFIHVLPVLLRPYRPVCVSDVREPPPVLVEAQCNLDALIQALRSVLDQTYGIEEIPAYSGVTRFDSRLHSDNFAHRLPAPDPESSNVVYERIAPGFTYSGKVYKAHVKRYMGYLAENHADAEPDPASSSPPRLDVVANPEPRPRGESIDERLRKLG